MPRSKVLSLGEEEETLENDQREEDDGTTTTEEVTVQPLASPKESRTPETPSLLMKIGRVLDVFYQCDTSAVTGFADEAQNCAKETVTIRNALECAQGMLTCDAERLENTGLVCDLPGDIDSLQDGILASRPGYSPRSMSFTTEASSVPYVVMKRDNETICEELTLDPELMAMEREEEKKKLRETTKSALDTASTCSKSSKRSIRRLFQRRSHIANARKGGKRDSVPSEKSTVVEKKEGSLRRLRTALLPPRTSQTTTTPKLAKRAE